MKRLLLLLILSFFSTTGYSGTSYPVDDGVTQGTQEKAAPEPPKSFRNCPDGSEPTKSVSDDGYYFVYNCGSVPEVPIVSPKAKVSSETTSDKSAPGDLGEDDYIAKIKEAKALLDSGIISEEQFAKMIDAETQAEEDDYIAKIKEVKALLDSGIISEEQFEKMKQKIIDNI